MASDGKKNLLADGPGPDRIAASGRWRSSVDIVEVVLL
jgi:hypothetical protein